MPNSELNLVSERSEFGLALDKKVLFSVSASSENQTERYIYIYVYIYIYMGIGWFRVKVSALGGGSIGCFKNSLHKHVFAETELVESPNLTLLDFYSWGWMKNEVYKRKLYRWGDLLARILDAAASIKRSEGQLRRTTRDFRRGVVKFIDVGGGIL